MDPVMELATVTVSYLWAWRDLFKGERAFPGSVAIKPTAVSDESADDYSMLVALVSDKAGDDYSMLVRLRELTARAPHERWLGTPTTAVGERESTDFEEVMRECADRLDQKPDDWKVVTIARWTKRRFVKLEGKELSHATKLQLVRTYAKHMAALATLLGTVQFREAPDPSHKGAHGETREELTASLAGILLSKSLLSRIAKALDYRPMLMRLHPTLSSDDLDDPEYPQRLLEGCLKEQEPIPFQFVLHEELKEIEASRKARYAGVSRDSSEERVSSHAQSNFPDAANDEEPGKEQAPTPQLAVERSSEMELLGLSLSGGGIRSATFNLGILQALASRGWLPRVDYLSTVSGGGYIGAWFLAWIKRRGSVTSVQESLRGIETRRAQHRRQPFLNVDPADPHVRPIRFLREYSNYLAPMAGFFTADTWTMVSTWLRNTVLNLLVLGFSLMALLIAPRLAAHLTLLSRSAFWPAVGAIALVLSAALLIGFNLRSFEGKRRTNVTNPTRGDSTLIIALTIVLPLFIAAASATAALWIYPPDIPVWPSQVFNVFGLCCLTGLFVTVMVSNYNVRGVRDKRAIEQEWIERLGRAAWKAVRTCIFSGALAAIVGGGFAMLISQLVVPRLWEDTQRGVWIFVAFGPLLVLIVLACVIVVYLGLEGTRFPDERREWWSRLGALMGLTAAAWALVACISFFAPLWVARLGLYANVAGLGWVALTAVGARLASSGRSNGGNPSLDRSRLKAGLIKVAPFVFVLGFLVLLSVSAHGLLRAMQARRVLVSADFTVFDQPPFQLQRYVETYWATLEPRSIAPLVVVLVLCTAAALLAWRVDVNEFSMHHFYRNRLVRAYLGASRSPRHRWPNAFTGFDLDDDIKLSRFRTSDRSVINDASSDCRGGFAGPYPLINAALNTSGGEDLAWQERKARSFVFAPLYCGYDFSTRTPSLPERVQAQFAYRPTLTFGSAGEGQGLGIGTAIAISGAAASPNAGFHTSPAVAFLLTVFNARLGWWIGNPRSSRWDESSPTFGLFYLLSELFGFANTSREYVNLSDGGHFDNLGLYELVRRRCLYIVVCDAEQDQDYSLQGLGNAIRKCRIDFGVVITWGKGEIEAVRPDPTTKLSKSHIAVGRILYPGVKREGRILYVKASIHGHDEPPDVLEYRKRFPDFPHQSTADQFFDESQFESYRALGQHIGEQLPRLRWPADRDGSEPLAMVFTKCEDRARMARDGSGP